MRIPIVPNVFIHAQICNPAQAEVEVDRSGDLDNVGAIGMRQQRHTMENITLHTLTAFTLPVPVLSLLTMSHVYKYEIRHLPN